MTPTSSSDQINPSYKPTEKFVIDAVRPLSLYRTHLISINGESETEIDNNKEKTSTGKINTYYFISNYHHSSL